MSALAPYVDLYIEATQQNWGISKLGEDILCFLRPNNSTSCKTWKPELLLALQELSEFTDLARGLNHIMEVTKKRIDETVEGEKLVIWITAKDVEQAVENVTEEDLQNAKQEKLAKKQARKEERERIAREEKEELERRAAEDAEREKRRLALEEDDEDSDEDADATGITPEDERGALRRVRDGKKKLTLENETLDTIELTQEESARYQAEMAANDTEEQSGSDDMEFVEYTPEQMTAQNAVAAEQSGEEETTHLSRSRVEDAKDDAEDGQERTSKRIKTTPDEVDESDMQDSQSSVQDETATPEQQGEDATPAQPAKKRTRKRGKKWRHHKPEETEAASSSQQTPEAAPAPQTSQRNDTSPGNTPGSTAPPRPAGPPIFEDNNLTPTFLAPEPLNPAPTAKTLIPADATLERRIAIWKLERDTVEDRAHAHREMARAHMENAKSRDLLARGKEIEREIRVLEMAKRGKGEE